MSNEKIEETSINLEEKYKDIYNIFKEKGCTLTYYVKKTEKLKFICVCGLEKERLYKDFMRDKKCRTCTNKKLKEMPTISFESKNNISEIESIDKKEIWKPIEGGWISNFGNAQNVLGKILTLCPTKFRYNMGGKQQYASRLVAEAFQIENYDKIQDPNYVVSHIDKNSANNNIENLKIVTKIDIQRENAKKSHQSDIFSQKINWTKDHFKDNNLKSKVIHELSSKHIIYENGEIWNGNRFLAFSNFDDYLSVSNFKVHRLICYAFNPIEGKEKLSDYEKLQVNHKDGNTLNNHADNLEWVTPSENMKHSYSTKLNKKTRAVLQYNLEGEFIKEFISISEASRKTEEPEHRIRTISQGKTNTKALFLWKFKNDEETEEYSKKFSKS